MKNTNINPTTEVSTRIEITTAMVSDVRQMMSTPEKEAMIAGISKKHIRNIHQEFINNDVMDQKIADAFNSDGINGQNLESIVVSRVSYKMPYYGALTFSTTEYYREVAKLSLVKTLLNGFATAGFIHKRIDKNRTIVDGKIKWETIVLIDFEGEESIRELTKGIHTEPGMLDGQHIHVKPGAKKLKLSSTQKKYLRKESSKALTLVNISEDKLRAYYEQTSWYINAKDQEIEDPILLSERVERYIKIVMELQTKDKLYLTQWFDSRLRSYYTCSLLGVNPHGDTFETSMWEFSDAETISREGYEELVWASVIIGVGRRNRKQSLAYWCKHETEVREAMLKVVESSRGEDGKYIKGNFGEVFYNERMLQAIDDYKTNTPSKFMLGIDYTTGGLQHFGTAFKSVKSMKASNIGGLKIVKDAHGIMGKAFGIERESAKKINTPLLHGATYKSIAGLITEATKEKYTEGQVRKYVIEAYGREIENIQSITNFGDEAYDTKNSTLMFTTVDGEKAQSTCYLESVRLVVQGIAFEGNAQYSSCTLHRDMPYVLTAEGRSVYDVKSKNRGLYANITHSIDGATLRSIDASLRKHDKFYCRPGNMDNIRETGRTAAKANMRRNGYVSAMKEIAENHKSTSKIIMPDLIVGAGTEQMIEESDNFIIG